MAREPELAGRYLRGVSSSASDVKAKLGVLSIENRDKYKSIGADQPLPMRNCHDCMAVLREESLCWKREKTSICLVCKTGKDDSGSFDLLWAFRAESTLGTSEVLGFFWVHLANSTWSGVRIA